MAILFLVFELEVVTIFPWIMSYGIVNQYMEQLLYLSIFILILCISLVYEWSNGGLEWE
jgi:NADH:ubiquinone oxidoreductase subunit 3 (subunit A)